MSTVLTMRAKFSDEEWTLVRHVPLDAFLMAALADGEMAPEEAGTFAEEVAHAEGLIDPLHREVALDLRAGHLAEELAFQTAEDATQMRARIDRTRSMLQSKLTQDEYQRFIASVFITGTKVARAAGGGGGLFRSKSAISEMEKTGLTAFAIAYGLDVTALERFPNG